MPLKIPATTLRRIACSLLLPLLLAGTAPSSSAQVTEPKKPTVQKPVKPTVKKPVANKPAKATAPAKPKRRTVAAAGAAAAAGGGAAALAAGTQVAPALPATADPELKAMEAKARDGDVESQVGLADALTSQTPTSALDMRRALYWYGQAAAKGDADAAWTLAELFRGDLGIPDDMEQAAGWYRKAAEMGHAEAAFDLGLLYTEGYGVERDTSEAARWFQQAADAGVARALYMLGTLYEQGVDGAADLEAARAWYRQAQEAGDSGAGQALRRLDAGGRNVQVAAGPPAGMLGGPPGSASIRRSTTSGNLAGRDEEDGAEDDSPAPPKRTVTISGAAAGDRPIPVDQAGVREIQTRLVKLGFQKGKADGFLGKRTVAAIRAYQKSVGLPTDGKPTQALLHRLRQG
ncbi:SEL1-like repeat protein [Niveispirillum sp.]|uniref:SEL1-like repeat protein n=1 Tax=Niveispirillum sp. TaxID=1917217 RepID=UPI001B72FF0F|nr:SEL1-like repeat protein [Niveispirillum sp.]MBP7335316.1 SEL1-like repeat protein [Niveispirillum sp.]